MITPTRIPFFGVDQKVHYIYGLSLENRTNFLELRAEAIACQEQAKVEGINAVSLFDDRHSPFRSLIETCLGYSNVELKTVDLGMALLFVIGNDTSPGLIMELNFPQTKEEETDGEELPDGVHPEMANRAALWSHVENPEMAQRMAREEPWNELSQVIKERSRQMQQAAKQADKPPKKETKISDESVRKNLEEWAAVGGSVPPGYVPVNFADL